MGSSQDPGEGNIGSGKDVPHPSRYWKKVWIKCEGWPEGKEVLAKLDPGSTASFLNLPTAELWGIPVQQGRQVMELETADGRVSNMEMNTASVQIHLIQNGPVHGVELQISKRVLVDRTYC